MLKDTLGQKRRNAKAQGRKENHNFLFQAADPQHIRINKIVVFG